jgi:hypothetical protein
MHSAFRFETFPEMLAKAVLGRVGSQDRGGAVLDSVPKMEKQHLSLAADDGLQTQLLQHDASMGAI